ncbi:hypothetical protein F511_24947 [Dorcoceras hygrometricum]|uniref:C2 domain-containing protein n=1 Tax=Dorcoceras hygrometricum TaxID=472368 RepID=A0A2Z7CBW6_9LAMI|nr:hypothetical protein F511_24947 [Dorcoceras hygrometricum]
MTVFKLLEITIISAQDLPPLSKMLRTFAVSYISPDNRLSTAVDHRGNCNPNWNHKVVFNVDERFLKSKSSAITFEIYNVAWLRDLPIGTAHLMINSLSPSLHRSPSLRRVSLQVLRPSGLLKGTLNIGIHLLESNNPGLNEICHSGIANEERLDCADQEDGKREENEPCIVGDSAGQVTNPGPHIFQSNHGEQTQMHSSGPETNLPSNSEEMTQTQQGKTTSKPPEPDNTSIHGSENVRKWLYSNDNEEYGSSIFENWTEAGEKSEEEVQLKLKSAKRRLTDDDKIPLRNGKKAGHHKRGRGLLSCFGNAYGFQFSFICGSKKLNKKMHGRKKTQKFTLISRP